MLKYFLYTNLLYVIWTMKTKVHSEKLPLVTRKTFTRVSTTTVPTSLVCKNNETISTTAVYNEIFDFPLPVIELLHPRGFQVTIPGRINNLHFILYSSVPLSTMLYFGSLPTTAKRSRLAHMFSARNMFQGTETTL